jgi:hypothetical protein
MMQDGSRTTDGRDWLCAAYLSILMRRIHDFIQEVLCKAYLKMPFACLTTC